MSFRNLLRLVSWRRVATRPYERDVLASVGAALPHMTRTVLEHQVARISFAQRHVVDKEVNFYFEDGALANSALLPSEIPEWPIAMVRCPTAVADEFIRATVWVVSGKLFSIVFSDPPSQLLARGLGSLPVTLLVDASDEIAAAYLRGPLSSVPQPRIEDLIAKLRMPVDRISVRSPLAAAIRERFWLPVADCAPLDFSEILAFANGFEVGRWRVSGLPLREVAMEESNLFVLAESEGGEMLCAIEKDRDRRVQRIELEDGRTTGVAEDFITALRKPPR